MVRLPISPPGHIIVKELNLIRASFIGGQK